MRRQLTMALVYVAAAIAVTWPSLTVFGEAVPGGRGTDAWNSIWSLNQWASAIAGGDLPWRIESLNFPDGGTLLISDPLGATLVAPVVWLADSSVAFSVLVWFQVAFAGWVTHRFASEFLVWRRGSGSAGWGPWVSGMAMLTAPVLSSHVHNGATEALSVGWTVLGIWMAWRAAVDATPARLVAATFSIALAALAHWYGGVIVLVFAAAIALCGTGAPGPVWSVGRWVPLLAGGLLCSTLAIGASTIHRASDSLVQIKVESLVQQTTRSVGSADPLTYALPGDHRSPDFRKISPNDERFVHGHFLGFVLVGLGVWTLARRRRHTAFLVVGGMACMALSLGPVLIHAARPVLVAGDLAVPLPFFLLESFAGFSAMSLPWKLSLGPAAMLAMLAGVAVDMRGRRMALLAIGLVWLEASWWSPTAELREALNTEPAPSLVALADAPEGAVMNYPLQAGRPYLFEQTIHGKPLAGTLNQVGNGQAMRLWGRILTESRSDPDTFHQAVSSTAERLGIRYLVIHTDPDAEPDVYSKAVAELERLFDIPEWGRGQVRVVPLW